MPPAARSPELEPRRPAENRCFLKPGQLLSPCLSRHQPPPFTLASTRSRWHHPFPLASPLPAGITPSRPHHPVTLASPPHARITPSRSHQADPNARARSGQSVRAEARSGAWRRVTGRGGFSPVCFVQVGGQKGVGTDWIKSVLKMQDEYRASMA